MSAFGSSCPAVAGIPIMSPAPREGKAGRCRHPLPWQITDTQGPGCHTGRAGAEERSSVRVAAERGPAVRRRHCAAERRLRTVVTVHNGGLSWGLWAVVGEEQKGIVSDPLCGRDEAVARIR